MNAGARGKRPPVGPEGLRRRAFRFRTSRKARAARAAFGASLALMFGATAAVAGEVTRVDFVGSPSSGYYKAGEEIGIEVTFDEPVTVTGAPTFTLTVGRRARNMAYDTQASSGATLSFNYSVVAGDVDDDGVSYGSDALMGGRIESGSPPAAVDRIVTAIARDRGHRVDARKPRVVDVRLTSNPGPDRVYGIADVVEVTVTFDESVTASSAALALTVGTESRDILVANTGPGQTLVFRYTVGQDDEDANGVSVVADALSGTINDAAGNDAILNLPRVTDQSGHAVDGVPPAHPALRIVSNPRGGGIYRRGEPILVELGFDEAVRVSGGAKPTLELQIGTGDDDVMHSATYDPDRSGGRALVFRYAVQDADRDQDGISVRANAVALLSSITDSAGNEWDGEHSALSEQRSHRVDGSLPTSRVTGVDVTSVGPYGIGDSIALEVRFSGAVYKADRDIKFRLRVGDETKEMDFRDGNGSEMLRFEYEVVEGDRDDDGVGYAANALAGSGRLVDGHDWPVDRTVVARARLTDQVVDGVYPRLLDEPLQERSSPRDGDTYARGESIEIAVMFDERVTVSHVPDLKLALRIGDVADARRGVLVSGDGTDTLVFRYTVQDGDQGDNVEVTGLKGGEVGDLAGNPANVAGVAGNNLVIKIDGVAPGGATVRIVSDAGGDHTYAAGDRIEMEVVFDDDVQVSGRPVLLVSFESPRHGALTRRATLERTRPKLLAFAYTVQPGDIDTDGISIGSEALQGGRITDAVGNPVTRSLEAAIKNDEEHSVDAVEPSVDGIAITSDPGPDGTYAAGDGIIVTVTFDEDVYVKRPFPPLALVIAVGAASRSAVYVDGSGTTTLRFRYEVQVGDRDDDGISMGPDALDPEGAISDVAGNLPGRIPAMRRQSGHKVAADGVPTVTSVRILAPPGGGGFRANDRIDAHVVFDRVVHVTGAPVLTLSIGANNRAASFAGGSGTDTLRFHYTVVAADRDDDGISVPANALSEGTITDDTGNRADRRFRAVPPDTRWTVDGSVVGTVNASLAITAPEAGTTYGLGEDIEIEVRFDTVVHATGDPVLVLEIGGGTADAALVSGSGTTTLTFRYRVQEGDFDDDGISIGPGALREGRIEDGAGNVVERTFVALAADSDHRVDGVRPVLTQVEIVSDPDASGFYGLDDEIRVEVAFGEVVHVDDSLDLSLVLSIGEYSRAATFVGGSGTKMLTFRYVVQENDYDDDGISIGPSALRGGTIEDAAGNPVERTFAGLEADIGQTVDGRLDRVIPAILRVAITSDAGSNDTYTTDDTIKVDVEFNVAVYVTGAPPVLELSIGPALRDALFVEGSGTATLKFEYTVEAGDTDTDGISIAANSLTGGITDANGNAVDLTFEAVPRSASHKVSAELLLFPLSLTLIVGQSHTLDLLEELERLGVEYVGEFEWSSDDATVATATLSGGSMLTITSVAEGTARIAVAATDAAIFLFFGVTVETSAAETAVLEDAMAAVGRGLLASAGSTIGERLEVTDANSSDDWGGRGMAPASAAAWPQWYALDGADHWGSPPGYGRWGMDDPYLQGSTGYTPAQWLRGARFEMPLRGFGNPVSSLAVWGAGDWHAFEGEGDDGLYDGSLTSAYLGVDARGDGWVAGASVSRAMADASYEYGGAAGGKGRLETELNVIHPYVQWAFRDRGKMWAILGFGTGEATAEREDQEGASEPGELSMRMGLGGIRYSFGRLAGVDLAVRGDAGFAQLETDEGPRAVQGLAVDVQRLRIGAEASLPMALRGVPVSPFINVAARFDGGDGATGGGVELAGGFRYQGSAVSLEVKGRTLAMHADESYSEEGVKATLVVGPDSRKGFRLLLSPRWGGAAEAMDIFRYQGHPFAGALRRENRGWGLGSRVSYGFDMWRRPGTIMPFGEVDLSREAYRRARVGVSYELASAILGLPHRLEISSESAESDRHGTVLRFLLTGQAHF